MRALSRAALIAACCLAAAGCGGSATASENDSAEPEPPFTKGYCYVADRGSAGDCITMPGGAGSLGEPVAQRAEAHRGADRFDDQVARLENELDEPYGLDGTYGR